MISILVLAIAYLLGSIPFGFLLTKLAGLGDIRDIGSGNIGATNVLRTGNKGLAALTLVLDGLKGVAAVGVAILIAPDEAMLAGLIALLGHMYPVWLKFKGGKGVATAIGVLLALAWPVGLAVTATWLIIAKVFRRSSLAALVALALAPVFALIIGRPPLALLAGLVGALVWARHATNIRRLLKGTEPLLGSRRRLPALKCALFFSRTRRKASVSTQLA